MTALPTCVPSPEESCPNVAINGTGKCLEHADPDPTSTVHMSGGYVSTWSTRLPGLEAS